MNDGLRSTEFDWIQAFELLRIFGGRINLSLRNALGFRHSFSPFLRSLERRASQHCPKQIFLPFQELEENPASNLSCPSFLLFEIYRQQFWGLANANLDLPFQFGIAR